MPPLCAGASHFTSRPSAFSRSARATIERTLRAGSADRSCGTGPTAPFAVMRALSPSTSVPSMRKAALPAVAGNRVHPHLGRAEAHRLTISQHVVDGGVLEVLREHLLLVRQRGQAGVGKNGHAADMVLMPMGEEDGAHVLGFDAVLRQARAELLGPPARVEEHGPHLGLDEVTAREEVDHRDRQSERPLVLDPRHVGATRGSQDDERELLHGRGVTPGAPVRQPENSGDGSQR